MYTGLLKHIVKTEDELAAVLAHEVAHVIARHAGERLTQVMCRRLPDVLGSHISLTSTMPSALQSFKSMWEPSPL